MHFKLSTRSYIIWKKADSQVKISQSPKTDIYFYFHLEKRLINRTLMNGHFDLQSSRCPIAIGFNVNCLHSDVTSWEKIPFMCDRMFE